MKKRIFSILMILVMMLYLSASTFAWSNISSPDETNDGRLHEADLEVPEKDLSTNIKQSIFQTK